MIRLNVFIRTTESNREELLRTARELTAASVKDAGCIAYDIFESATRPDVLMICETWSTPRRSPPTSRRLTSRPSFRSSASWPR